MRALGWSSTLTLFSYVTLGKWLALSGFVSSSAKQGRNYPSLPSSVKGPLSTGWHQRYTPLLAQASPALEASNASYMIVYSQGYLEQTMLPLPSTSVTLASHIPS